MSRPTRKPNGKDRAADTEPSVSVTVVRDAISEHLFVTGVLKRHTAIMDAELRVAAQKAGLKHVTEVRDEFVDDLNAYISAYRKQPAPLPLFESDDQASETP